VKGSIKTTKESVATIIAPGTSYKTDQKDEKRNQLLSKETEKLLIASRKRMQKVRSKLELQNTGIGSGMNIEDSNSEYIKILTRRNKF